MPTEAPEKIALIGEITDELAKVVIAKLLFHHMQYPKLPADLIIDSPGGSATATFAIVDTMKFVKVPVRTHCIGQASGCALLILASGAKGQRTARPETVSSFCRTVLKESKINDPKTHMFLRRINAHIVSLFAEIGNVPERQVALDMENELVFSTPGLITYGLIDAIVAEP